METVLWQGCLQTQRYGELQQEVAFARPVLVTGIRATGDSSDPVLQQLPHLVKGYARDFQTPPAARYDVLFNALAVYSGSGVAQSAVSQVLATQHVLLRGRCHAVTLQLLGYQLDEAPQRIKEAAEARLCPLREANPVLAPPHLQPPPQPQQQQQPHVAQGPDAPPPPPPPPPPQAAPSLSRPPGKQLPLGKIPPAFVLTLAPLADYWGQHGRRIPLELGDLKPGLADLHACEEMAAAVLAAQRGCPANLQQKLAHSKNTYGLAVDWDGIRDRVLDMATYCCSALSDTLSTSWDVGLATAGVCAAIMLAACQDGAAQFLAWPSGGVGVAGAIAVRDLVSIPNQPQKWQDMSMGLLDLLLESCPAIACPTLQGTLNPAGIPEPEPQQAAQDQVQEDKEKAAAAGEAGGARDDAGGGGDAAITDSPTAAAAAAAAAEAADGNPADPAAAGGGDAGGGDAGDGEQPPKRQRLSSPADGEKLGADGVPARAPDAAGAGADAGQAAAAGARVEAAGAETAAAGAGEPNATAADGPDPAAVPTPATDGGEQQQPEADPDAARAGDAAGAGACADAATGAVAATDGAADAVGSADADDDDAGLLAGLEREGAGGSSEGMDGGGAGSADGGGDGGSDGDELQGLLALDEGDYPEADEEAIKAEAAAKAARRGVEQRPLVSALARGQLYDAVLQLATSPLQQDAAASCSSVLRRLRAYQCLDVLQSTIGPMLSGKVNALLLGPAELSAHVSRVAAAANDLATLVLQPVPSGPSILPYGMQDEFGGGGSSSMGVFPQRQQQQADCCVLQLMLSFRALELLAALLASIGACRSRLAPKQSAQQQQQDVQPDRTQQQSEAERQQEQQEQQQQLDTAAQRAQLCREHAQLLGSIRALTSSLTASSGGWCYLTAAREGLAALAAAVCPTRKVCLDGGPFAPDTSAAPYDTQHGWAADRQALLAAASGLSSSMTAAEGGVYGADEASSAGAGAAGDLADSLQRLWLLVDATATLQSAEDVLSGRNKDPNAADRLSNALKTLFVGGFGSEVGAQALVSALSACSPVVRHLGVLVEHCGKVQAAAAGQLDVWNDVRRRSHYWPYDLSQGSRIVPGAMYAPEMLLALLTAPHADAVAAWLPHTRVLHDIVRGQLDQTELFCAAAAKAACDDPASSWGGAPLTALLPGGSEAVKADREQLVFQLHGVLLTANALLELWQQRAQHELVGAGSGSKLVEWAHRQLPELVRLGFIKQAGNAVDVEDRPKLPPVASGPVVAATAAADMPQLDGAAAALGVPPPADKDVTAKDVLEFMRNPACRSAALCALHVLDVLLRGAPQAVRDMARGASSKASRRRQGPAIPAAFMQVDGSLRCGIAAGALGDASSDAAAASDDGFAAPALLRELLDGVSVDVSPRQPEGRHCTVFEVLERALRTATVALRASDADLAQAVRGGVKQDLLPVLQARSAAASLMRAACSTTASLLVHLTDADPQRLERQALQNESLLDALICAHTTIVTSSEGLQGCVPQPGLSPLIAKATDPALNPVQRLAADAAVSSAAVRLCSARVLLLLEARQSLAVGLRCWQLQGWWPDPVGALLGVYPRASAVVEEFAKQAAAARAAGDLDAPPPPAPRQGPRQLLASLLGLADLCPEEWPPRGASQAAARARDAAAAAAASALADKSTSPATADAAAEAEGAAVAGAAAFERPSLILLRQRVAESLDQHWSELEHLIGFGVSCRTRVARLALVRMLGRMAGLGGGMAPLLAPQLLLALCGHLYDIQQARKGLADRLHDIKALPSDAADKQLLLDEEIGTVHSLLRGAVEVAEVLLPLCRAPSIKSALTEHKAAGVLGKGVYAVVRPLQDLQQLQADEAAAAAAAAGANGGVSPRTPAAAAGPGLARLGVESQALAGVLLQLVGVLMDPDISMNPWADRATRELHDTPSIFTSSITVSWLLAAAPNLNPANMAAVARLLVGRSCSTAGATEQQGAPDPSSTHAAEQQQQSSASASAAAGGVMRGLRDAGKGRAVLLRVGRQWKMMHEWLKQAEEREAQARMGVVPPPMPEPAKGPGLTQPELEQSAGWAAAALDATQWVGHDGAPDTSHAASCGAIAKALREVAGSGKYTSSVCAAAAVAGWQEYEAVVQAEAELVPVDTRTKFIKAVKAAAAAHQSTSLHDQSIATLLSQAPLLLACDAACLDFWNASAASVDLAASCPPPTAVYPHNAAQPTATASSWWPTQLLLGSTQPRQRSEAIEEVAALAEEEEQRRRDRLAARSVEESPADAGAEASVPAVFAQRGLVAAHQWADSGSRKASLHVDAFQAKQQPSKQGKAKQQRAKAAGKAAMPPAAAAGAMPPPAARPPPPPPPPPPRRPVGFFPPGGGPGHMGDGRYGPDWGPGGSGFYGDGPSRGGGPGGGGFPPHLSTLDSFPPMGGYGGGSGIPQQQQQLSPTPADPRLRRQRQQHAGGMGGPSPSSSSPLSPRGPPPGGAALTPGVAAPPPLAAAAAAAGGGGAVEDGAGFGLDHAGDASDELDALIGGLEGGEDDEEEEYNVTEA